MGRCTTRTCSRRRPCTERRWSYLVRSNSACTNLSRRILAKARLLKVVRADGGRGTREDYFHRERHKDQKLSSPSEHPQREALVRFCPFRPQLRYPASQHRGPKDSSYCED